MSETSANPVTYLELQTRDLPSACTLLTRLFGWHAETLHVGAQSYLTLDLGKRIEGGVVQRDAEPALWLPYVEVACITEASDLAQALGASTVTAPREGPVGWRSVLETPACGRFALWQPKR